MEVSFIDDLGFAETVASDAVAIREARLPASCPEFSTPEGHARLGDVTVAEVGPVRFAGTPIAYGWYEGGAILSRAGRIEVSGGQDGGRLAMLGQTYEIEGAYAGTAGSLTLNLDAPVSDAERARLVLHYCGEAYAFADAVHDAITHAYNWRHGRDRDGGDRQHHGSGGVGALRSLPIAGSEWTRTGRRTRRRSWARPGPPTCSPRKRPSGGSSWEVSFTDDGGNPEVRRSDPFPAVGTVIANSPATGAPGISGSGRIGETLSATAGDIADADGLAGASFSYRWYRVNPGAVPETEEIPGAEAQDYMPVEADAGHRVLVKVSFTDDAGFVDPGPRGVGLALREYRHRRVVAVQTLRLQHVRRDEFVQRP